MAEIAQLEKRLEDLQKKNLQNDRRKEQAKSEADLAYQNATAVKTNAERYIIMKLILKKKLQ